MTDTSLWHPFADMGAVRTSELVIERGEDVWVWDADGNRYLDGTAALWYANVGHGRAEIAAAAAEQMERIAAYSAFGDFANRPALELAERLSGYAPMPDAKVFFGSGGGDGVDTAAKLARRYWRECGQPDRTRIIVRTNAYHGTHGYGTGLAGIPANREGWGPLDPEVSTVPHDSVEALQAEIDSVGAERVAAIFCEPVIGAGGLYPPAQGYVEGVAAAARDSGALFVCDSVIVGFGRLGTWFGIERWDVEPDIIIFAKGVTSGYLPLGGIVASGRVAEPFWSSPGGPMFRHGATYSAHPTCCAAALANLDILEDGVLERGRTQETVLLDAVAPLAEHDAVAEVRGGVGLLAAVELHGDLLAERPKAVFEVAAGCRRRGVLVRPLLKAIALSPPLTATEEHFGLAAEALAESIAELGGA